MKLIVLLAVFMLLPVFSFLPVFAQENRDFTVSGGSEGTDWTYANGVLTLMKGGPFTIGMADNVTMTGHRIAIDVSKVYDSTTDHKITLTLDNLNIERNTDSGIIFSNNPSDKPIEAEFVLVGNNKIKNSGTDSNSHCIGRSNYNFTTNMKISGSGSLELLSANINDDILLDTFTLNSGNVKMNNIAINTSESIYIYGGKLEISSSVNSTLIAHGEFYMSGGELIASCSANDKYCIEILTAARETFDLQGAGLEINGNAKVTLNASGSGNGAVWVYCSNNSYQNKSILIDTNRSVTIENKGSKATGIFFQGGDNRNFTIKNGTLLIKGFPYGIYRYGAATAHGNILFAGGETEIICTSKYAVYSGQNASSLVEWDSNYVHKTYVGSSPNDKTWKENDEGVDSSDGSILYQYLLITPFNKITYNLDKGLLPPGKSNPDSFSRFDFPFTLYNPVRYNSEFLGWTGSNGDTPATNVIIQTIGDKNYTANWKQIAAGVSISAGAGMSKTDGSGQSSQVLQENVPMTDVVYTADDGYYFPEDYAADVPSDSGITVRRDNLGQITVSGPRSLTADVHVILPAATEKEKKSTPTTAEFSASGADSGTLSGVKPGMQYSLDGGNTWTDISAESVDIPSGVTTENGILVREKGDGTTTLDSDPQIIEITKAEKPAGIKSADCTTSDNNDGKLIGVTDGMEYKPEGSETWIPVTGSEVTGLVPGTYQIRVIADGTALASDPVDMTVNPWTAPGQVPAPTFSHPSGTYAGTQHVTISCTEEEAAIHYTTDGTEPTTASPVYSEPITVKSDTVIRAFAVKDGMSDSPAAVAEYTIYVGKQINTDISFSSTYDGEPHGVVISVTDPAEGAVIRYGTSEGTYDLKESPTITDAGRLKVYYQVTAEGYEPLTGSVTLTITEPEGPSDPGACYPPCIP